MNEIVFEVTQKADGGFCAECLTESMFTQGDTWEELRANVSQTLAEEGPVRQLPQTVAPIHRDGRLPEPGSLLTRRIVFCSLLGPMRMRADCSMNSSMSRRAFVKRWKRGRSLAAEKRIELMANLNSESIVVRGDGEALRRLFFVLIDNAVKYTPEGGQVQVGNQIRRTSSIASGAQTKSDPEV